MLVDSGENGDDALDRLGPRLRVRWLVFRGERSGVRSDAPRTEVVVERALREPPLEAPPAAPAEAGAPDVVDVAAALREARESEDWKTFRETLNIAAAARARYEANVAAGETSWTGAKGWLHLVADRGLPEDLAWLLDIVSSGTGQHRHEAVEALVNSRNPAVAAFVTRLYETGRLRPEPLKRFAKSRPDAAFKMLDEELAKGGENWSALPAYATSVTDATLETAKRRLLDIRSVVGRLKAVAAVETLHERGLDIRGLEPILQAPLDVLRDPVHAHRSAGESVRLIVQTALYAIEYNEKVMWTPRVLAALESATTTASM